jgi:hypothetical protein
LTSCSRSLPASHLTSMNSCCGLLSASPQPGSIVSVSRKRPGPRSQHRYPSFATSSSRACPLRRARSAGGPGFKSRAQDVDAADGALELTRRLAREGNPLVAVGGAGRR